MDVLIYFLQLPYTVLFFKFNILGYPVSIGGVLLWVALIAWAVDLIFRLFD